MCLLFSNNFFIIKLAHLNEAVGFKLSYGDKPRIISVPDDYEETFMGVISNQNKFLLTQKSSEKYPKDKWLDFGISESAFNHQINWKK